MSKDIEYVQTMSLRDYFAGQVLMGLSACSYKPRIDDINKKTAEICYEMADTMIKTRIEKREDKNATNSGLQ